MTNSAFWTLVAEFYLYHRWRHVLVFWWWVRHDFPFLPAALFCGSTLCILGIYYCLYYHLVFPAVTSGAVFCWSLHDFFHQRAPVPWLVIQSPCRKEVNFDRLKTTFPKRQTPVFNFLVTVRNTSCGRLCFTSVCHSVHRGEVTPPRQTPPRETPPGQTPPPPGDGRCSWRCASYWNAFLFIVSKDWV